MNRLNLPASVGTLLALTALSLPAQDSRTVKVIEDSGSLVAITDPLTSTPGLIKRSLAGLGFLDPTPHQLRGTTITPSTIENLTREWPLIPGLRSKGWVGKGIPGFYYPPVERMDIEPANIPQRPQLEPRNYVFITAQKPETLTAGIRTDRYVKGDIVEANMVRPDHEFPTFVTPQYDFTGRQSFQASSIETAGKGLSYGGIYWQAQIASIPKGTEVAPLRRFRSASFWDTYDAPNDPRKNADPVYEKELAEVKGRRALFDHRDPDVPIDPNYPGGAIPIRQFFFPNFRPERSAGGR